MDRHHDLAGVGGHVEHAAVHRIALVALGIEDPDLVLVERGSLRRQADEADEAALR